MKANTNISTRILHVATEQDSTKTPYYNNSDFRPIRKVSKKRKIKNFKIGDLHRAVRLAKKGKNLKAYQHKTN